MAIQVVIVSLFQLIPAYSSIIHHNPAYAIQFQPLKTIIAHSSLFQPITAYFTLLQPIQAYSSLFQHIQAYYSPFKPITAYSRYITAYSSLFQAYSSLFLPIPACSSLCQPILTFSGLFQSIQACFSLFKPITAYSSIFCNVYQVIALVKSFPKICHTLVVRNSKSPPLLRPLHNSLWGSSGVREPGG